MPSPPAPFNIAPTTENLKFCCSFDRGTLTFGAAVDDTRVARGEEVAIAFSCKNQSTAEIEYVTTSITETNWWHTKGESKSTNEVLTSWQFQKEGNMQKMTKDELSDLISEHSGDSKKARAAM